jgi:hypothetical protein
LIVSCAGQSAWASSRSFEGFEPFAEGLVPIGRDGIAGFAVPQIFVFVEIFEILALVRRLGVGPPGLERREDAGPQVAQQAAGLGFQAHGPADGARDGDEGSVLGRSQQGIGRPAGLQRSQQRHAEPDHHLDQPHPALGLGDGGGDRLGRGGVSWSGSGRGHRDRELRNAI